MAKGVLESLFEKTNTKRSKNSKCLTITLSNENYNALDTLSNATKTSKAKIVLMALEEAGVFDMNKINKLIKGVKDDDTSN